MLEKVVIGGWVRSSKVEKKEPAAASPKDVSCAESLQSRIPFFGTIIKFLAGSASEPAVREKLEQPYSILFLQINDGSCATSLQVVVHSAIARVSVSQLLPTGTCILAEGVLQEFSAEGDQQKPSAKEKQAIELTVEKILHVGTVQNSYPLSEKRLPLDSLRDCSHFRPRTTTVASITRIRCALTLATHTFFQSHGFLHVEAPIITITDCEGFSNKFQVTTLFQRTIKEEPNAGNETQGISLETVKVAIKEKTDLVEQLKRSESNQEALAIAVKDPRKTNELAQQLEAREKSKPGTAVKGYGVNFNEDLFSRQTYLTVSGHLHLESYACSLGHDAIRCADDYFRFLCKWILDKCSTTDVDFLTKRTNKTIIKRLQSHMENSSEKITYKEVVDRLRKVTDKEFETELQWGVALTAEHLSYLADVIYKKRVIIYNYPKELKPFYVRLNDDRCTVAAFEMVLPEVGTLITGSQNEERVNMLNARIKEFKLPRDQYEWYLDLRRHGTVKHSGFSLAFDLMVLLTTGLTDVKDTIPFLRSDSKKINN
ncbi:hypothetical protein SLEP1_g529 [Rubroshorea leprosula]|uniref:Aminoacyl-tRNA synthetase class II (D/K/N) domain-containing protein n=1 Tax=Rubroshorea leprosula TaxID=152421 RepID=A0AAV5HLQ0_9ROSI|nr:hypothetical protein SLEP1_g529 [Rubroshorea leprosula]